MLCATVRAPVESSDSDNLIVEFLDSPIFSSGILYVLLTTFHSLANAFVSKLVAGLTVSGFEGLT